MAPPSSNRNKQIPVTLQHLQALRFHLTLTNTFDATVFAMACVSFWSDWCQCRLAEVCVDGAFDPSRHATRECLRLGGSTASGVKFGRFRAPYTKTSPLGQDIIWKDSACPCSTEWAFRNHLSINNNIPNTAALFAFEDKAGKPIPMPQTWFME